MVEQPNKPLDIFDTISLTWSKGSTINAPSIHAEYTATLLSNGMIVFIGGREEPGPNLPWRDVAMNQVNKLLILYLHKIQIKRLFNPNNFK